MNCVRVYATVMGGNRLDNLDLTMYVIMVCSCAFFRLSIRQDIEQLL
jgi:hypothetical protein